MGPDLWPIEALEHALLAAGFCRRLRNQHSADLTELLLCGIYHIVVYIEARAFTRRLHQLAGASALDVLSSIQTDLLIRSAGRENGVASRYLFLYLEDRNQIHLLYLLDKDEQEDLSADERKVLRASVGGIRGSRGGQQIQ